MRILDENGHELQQVDFSLGYYKEETIFIAHHNAQEYVPEQFHYEVVTKYLNGGKDVVRIIDAPGQMARDAWDEYENILRWHWYTEEQLAALRDYQDMKEALKILRVEA